MVDETIVETATEVVGDLSQLEKDLSQAVTSRKTGAAAQKTKQKTETSNDSDDGEAINLPAKLKGKSLAEVAEMYANLESAYGRMANDLGTQRKMTDRLLDLKRDTDLANNGAAAKPEIKAADLLENPTAALDRYSQTREQASEQRLQALEAQLAQAQLVAAHPDYIEVAQSAEFAAWVQGSPIRVRAVRSAQAGDYSAAADLLSEYKASNKKPVKKVDDADEADEDPRDAAKKASLESSSQSNAGVKKGGKVYRRADLMRLRAERPDLWDDPEFQQEILLAYAEKRVK